MRIAWRGIVLSLLFAAALARAGAAEPEPSVLLRDTESARKRLDVLLGFLSSTSVQPRLQAAFANHDKAAEAARAYLFDDAKYPIPAKAHTGWVPGKDTQPGYEEMERLVSASLAAYNAKMELLCVTLRAAPEACGDAKPTVAALKDRIPKVPSYGLYSAGQLFDQFLKAFDKEYKTYAALHARLKAAQVADTPKSEDRPLCRALGELAAGNFAASRDAAADLKDVEAAFYRVARDFYVLNWNAANLQGRSASEAQSLKVMNLYRLGLGLNPLVHSEKLQQVSKDFAEEMDRLKFLGHVHPSDPARKTMCDRGKRLGYPEICGECASSTGRGLNEIWEWRADAGHHRIMIMPDATEVGLGYTRHGVLNVGRGAQSPVTALYRPAEGTRRGVQAGSNPFIAGK